NCKPRENSKRTFVRGRVTTYMSALGLSALALSNQSAQAQNCNELCAPAISCGVSIQNLATGLGSGTFARVGDTIRINSVNVGIVQGSCFVADGAFGNTGGWVAKPNGAGGQIVQKSHGTYQLTAIGQVHICNGTVGNPCLAFNTDYVVSDADVNRPLSIGSPTELPATFADSGPVVFPGNAGQIHFLAATEGTGFKCDDVTQVSGPARGNGGAFIRVIHPSITITKECVDNCPGVAGEMPLGQPGQFRGQVCNTGDVPLINVVVTDTPEGGAPVQVATFGTLAPGQCTNYTGSYTPSGNPCGPFRDTVSVTATPPDQRPVSASAQATCTVCTTPCIEVIKDCIDTNVPAGQPIRYRFTVRNCGDVPLQNVVAVDDSATPGNPSDDVTTQVGNLAVGQTAGPFNGTFQTSADDCRVGRFFFTNTVRATGANICNPAQTVSDSDDCVAHIICMPCIRITEEVVCVKPDTLCDAFTTNPNDQTNACGMRNESSTDCSAFCFKIVIEAVCIDGTPSPVPVSNIHVTSKLNLSNCTFPSTLQPGGMAMCIIPAVTLCTNFTDIVTVTATGPDNTPVPPDADDTDSVSVVIRPIAVRCVSTFTTPVDTDGNPNNNCATIPQSTTATPITLTTTVFNDSDVDLVVNVNNLPPLVNCNDRVTPVNPVLPLAIPARGSRVITGCYMATCQDVTFNINVKGTVDTNSPTADCRCFYNRDGRPIMTDVNANDNCPVCVMCTLLPDIEVYKEVACLLPGDTCGPFGKSATGVRDGACPAFCYRVSITNVGPVPIVTLTVTDPVLGGNISSLFGPLPIAPGDVRTAVIKPIVHCVDTPDTVRAEGRSASGAVDVDEDSAMAHVLNINILCSISLFATNDLDGNPNDAHVLVPGSQPVQFTLTLRNTGSTALQVDSLNGLPA